MANSKAEAIFLSGCCGSQTSWLDVETSGVRVISEEQGGTARATRVVIYYWGQFILPNNFNISPQAGNGSNARGLDAPLRLMVDFGASLEYTTDILLIGTLG